MTNEEFYNKYCALCGSQRCIGDEEELQTCGYYRKEELSKQKKPKQIKVHIIENPCNNCQTSTEDDCDIMGDFCKKKKEYQHKRIAAMKNEQRRKQNEKNSCSN